MITGKVLNYLGDSYSVKASRRFLIVGLKELDAGKTTIAQALLLCLKERKIKACGFKPKASNTI